MSRIVLFVLLGMLAGVGAAHGGGHGDANQGMMADCLSDSGCHMMLNMMGYGWFGMGTAGMVFGLLLWILVILAIVYLYKQIVDSETTAREPV